MNVFAGIGRITSDPETRYSQGDQGTLVTRFTLACDRRFKREGEPTADFIRCVAFGKPAEIISKYVTKGRQVGISGEVRTGSYKDRDGKTIYTTDIVVSSVSLIGGQQDRPAATQSYAQPPAPQPEPQQTSIDPVDFAEIDNDDSLPF